MSHTSHDDLERRATSLGEDRCQVLGAPGVFPYMHLVYLAITSLAVLANGYAAVLNFAGAESVKVVAERVQVSQRWMVPFGVLLAAGAVGLAVGLAVPVLGIAAAIGLVLYFIGAVGAHLRARDPGFGGALFFLALAVCTLAANVADQVHS